MISVRLLLVVVMLTLVAGRTASAQGVLHRPEDQRRQVHARQPLHRAQPLLPALQ